MLVNKCSHKVLKIIKNIYTLFPETLGQCHFQRQYIGYLLYECPVSGINKDFNRFRLKIHLSAGILAYFQYA